jgi:hypothetical protein
MDGVLARLAAGFKGDLNSKKTIKVTVSSNKLNAQNVAGL